MSKRHSIKMSREIVLKIKEMLAGNNLFQHQIAALVGVNQGRISETKHGKWDYLL